MGSGARRRLWWGWLEGGTEPVSLLAAEANKDPGPQRHVFHFGPKIHDARAQDETFAQHRVGNEGFAFTLQLRKQGRVHLMEKSRAVQGLLQIRSDGHKPERRAATVRKHSGREVSGGAITPARSNAGEIQFSFRNPIARFRRPSAADRPRAHADAERAGRRVYAEQRKAAIAATARRDVHRHRRYIHRRSIHPAIAN